MRTLVASDLHIFPFSQFAEYDSQGVPDRLTSYLELSKRMCLYGKDKEIKVCILSGDICNAAVNKPMTLAITAKFLEMLSTQFEVYIIPGQHDLDSKSENIAAVHSIIKVFDNNFRIKYINDEAIYQIEDKKVYFRAWKQEGIIPTKDADVFVGHGIVKGASIPDGFIFNDGASVDELYSKYQLSIIGDIHNSQVFTDSRTDRKVLIPGTPFQNTHKDAEICGIWDASITDSVILKFERIIGPPFHYFYTDNGIPNQGLQYYKEDERKKYIHVRKVEPKKKPSSNSNVSHTVSSSSNQIEQIMLEEVHILKPANLKFCEQIINRLIGDVHVPNSKNIPNIKLQKLEVHNFGNIDHYEIDLEHTPSPLLIYGNNGSGKSTLLDSIYWALEGKTTKKLSVAKVVKRKSKDGCYVKLTFLRNDEVCTILRSRNHKEYGTNLIINDDLEKSSKADTQKLIKEQLGLDSNIILNSVYLSSRSIVVFGELTPANKYDLIGLLTDNEIVDAYRDQAKRYKDICEANINRYDTELLGLTQSIDTIEKTVTSLRTQEENSKKTVDHTLLFTKLNGIVEGYIPAGLNINEALPLIDNIKASKEFLEFLKGMVDYADIKAKGDALSIKRSELIPKITIAENVVSLSNESLKEYNDQWSKISTTSICYTCKSILANKQAEELKKTLDEKIVSAVNEKGKYEYQIQVDKKALDEVDTELNRYISQITKYNRYVNSLNEITSLELELSSVKTVDNSNAITELELNKSGLESDKKQKGVQLSGEYDNLACYKLIHDQLLSRNGSLIKRLVRGVCDNISQEIDNLLRDSPRIKCVVTMQDGSPKILAWIDEEECEYEELSSGEKQIIDLAVLIAFNNLIAKKFNQDNGILGSVFLDEVFCYLDPENAELANSILAKSVATLVMVVTHDHNLQDHFNNKLHVSKKGGSAVYQLLV